MNVPADFDGLRAAVEAAARGDLDALGGLVAPDFVFDDHTVPEDTTAERGMGAMRAEFERLNEAFEDYRAEVRELTDIGGSRLLAILHTSGRGRGSNVEIEGDVGEILTIRDGLVVKAEIFPSPQEAREAAGLEP